MPGLGTWASWLGGDLSQYWCRKAPTLEPIREVPMEVEDGAVLVQEDSATVEEENSTKVDQAT